MNKLSRTLSRLDLPSKLLSQIEHFIDLTKTNCLSILLLGSWARMNATADSDIDMLYVVSNDAKYEKVTKILSKKNVQTFKGLLQCDHKVVTSTNLHKQFNGMGHFGIWYALESSVLVFGEDFRPKMRFNPEKLRQLIIEMIERLEEVQINASKYLRFSGSCITLIDVAKTLYFVDCYLKHSKPSSSGKKELINEIFGSFTKKAIQIHQLTMIRYKRKLGFGAVLNIKQEDDLKHSKEEYESLLSANNRMMFKISKIYRKVITHLEGE